MPWRLIDDSHLVTQLAAMAPFGLLAPLASTGLVPTEAVDVVERKGSPRARLPEGFAKAVRDVQSERVAALHHSDLSTWVKSFKSVETGRGCPVAGRAIALNGDTLTVTS